MVIIIIIIIIIIQAFVRRTMSASEPNLSVNNRKSQVADQPMLIPMTSSYPEGGMRGASLAHTILHKVPHSAQ